MDVVSPAKGCIEVDSIDRRRRYRPDASGVYRDLPARDAKALLQFGGFVPSMLGPARKANGFRCTTCGFGSWFKRCSKCRTDSCEREA